MAWNNNRSKQTNSQRDDVVIVRVSIVCLSVAGGAVSAARTAVHSARLGGSAATTRTRPVHSVDTNVINKNIWKNCCKCREEWSVSSRTRGCGLVGPVAPTAAIGSPPTAEREPPTHCY